VIQFGRCFETPLKPHPEEAASFDSHPHPEEPAKRASRRMRVTAQDGAAVSKERLKGLLGMRPN